LKKVATLFRGFDTDFLDKFIVIIIFNIPI